jgi:hypothetical protein
MHDGQVLHAAGLGVGSRLTLEPTREGNDDEQGGDGDGGDDNDDDCDNDDDDVHQMSMSDKGILGSSMIMSSKDSCRHPIRIESVDGL